MCKIKMLSEAYNIWKRLYAPTDEQTVKKQYEANENDTMLKLSSFLCLSGMAHVNLVHVRWMKFNLIETVIHWMKNYQYITVTILHN